MWLKLHKKSTGVSCQLIAPICTAFAKYSEY
jgi:hypothetical protein